MISQFYFCFLFIIFHEQIFLSKNWSTWLPIRLNDFYSHTRFSANVLHITVCFCSGVINEVRHDGLTILKFIFYPGFYKYQFGVYMEISSILFLFFWEWLLYFPTLSNTFSHWFFVIYLIIVDQIVYQSLYLSLSFIFKQRRWPFYVE